MSKPIISIRGVGKRFVLGANAGHDTLRDHIAAGFRRLIGGKKTSRTESEHWALRDVSFDVNAGEVVGIIGRNGAGKSTLLKILSQIIEPSEGEIRVDGRIASLLEVGTGFHPELSGRENIYLNGAILGMKRAEIRAKFDDIVAFSEVEKFLDTPVKRYSSGMYVRLAFAVAAHLEPEILIVDEVLAVGDVEFQKKCLGKMQDVAVKEGRTVLFVSHNLNAVRSLCSRGLVMVCGQKHFDGSADRAITEYTSYTKKNSDLTWSRPTQISRQRIAFEKIDASVSGRQPELKLQCNVVLQAVENGEPVFIAVNICDQLHNPIMQALPNTYPFISGRAGRQIMSLTIDLPPLIPGHYILDFWLGTHFSSTIDYVKNVVAFEITDSPSSDRSFPHSPNHGFLVPVSRCEFLSV